MLEPASCKLPSCEPAHARGISNADESRSDIQFVAELALAVDNVSAKRQLAAARLRGDVIEEKPALIEYEITVYVAKTDGKI